MRETDSLVRRQELETDAVNVGRTFLLPLIAHRPISSSSLLTPRDAHMLGGQHTLKFAWVRVRGLVKQLSRNVEQSCM